ncbi:hypothetical protein NQ176_g11336 [Zarea fungicola]|uniref:Uncharacterized protein n=1 Tax=Zarea fungicola TaxID=93591 RepID=A0ACC1MBW5_9HYPO|nr:hypothetical protein NQ176_g11336 [Lecanicillium fungicola]
MCQSATSTTLTAKYTSPTNEAFAIDTTLPSATAPSKSTSTTTEKTGYLGTLRAAVTQAQATINKELTVRMDEDRARDAPTGASVGTAVDEDKEEENYGEEVQEEEG